jgi:nucleoside 2-deoxyribosyltransferase
MRRYDAFISYARKDGAAHAERLEFDLQREGLTSWRDLRDLDPDQDFSAELEEGIEASDNMLCCLTPDTRRRDSFVRREIGYAMAIGKPIVPLVFADTIPPIHLVQVTRRLHSHAVGVGTCSIVAAATAPF